MKKPLLVIIAMVLAAGAAGAADTTFTGASRSNGDNWNVAGNWNGGIPSGATNVFIRANISVTCEAASGTPTYTGSLCISNNSMLQIGYTTLTLNNFNALGTPGSTIITMYSGSIMQYRGAFTVPVPAIQLLGNATINLGTSTSGAGSSTFGQGITGPYKLTFMGKGGCNAYLTSSNNFSALDTSTDPWTGGGFVIRAQAAYSLPPVVTINTNSSGTDIALLIIDVADAMPDSALLRLNGNAVTKLTMNANDTIYSLFMNGTQQVRGVYTSSGMGSGWMTGAGSLTVSVGAPTQPTGLKAVPGAAAGSVRLDWVAVTDATGYNIKRSVTNSGYVTIGTASTTNYTDFTVQFMTNYYYVVSASNNYVESANSVAVSISLPSPGMVITLR